MFTQRIQIGCKLRAHSCRGHVVLAEALEMAICLPADALLQDAGEELLIELFDIHSLGRKRTVKGNVKGLENTLVEAGVKQRQNGPGRPRNALGLVLDRVLLCRARSVFFSSLKLTIYSDDDSQSELPIPFPGT